MNRFASIEYDPIANSQHTLFKAEFESLGNLVEAQLQNGREKSIVLKNLEEAYMWLGKAIKEEQLQRLARG